jgi:hypothetical protein
MDLFFNELSLNTASNRFIVNDWFKALGETYKIAATKGFSEVKIPNTFLTHSFSPNYQFFQWAEDKDFDQDLRTLLKSKITTTPIIEDLIEKQVGANKIFDCKYKNQNAVGLGAASEHLFDSIAISFFSEEWDLPEVEVTTTTMDDTNLEETSTFIRHVSHQNHFSNHEKWFSTIQRPTIANGSLLWLKRGSLFPNLEFCEHTKGQLSSFSGNQPEFTQIKKRLFELNDYAGQRGIGIFDPELIPSKVSPESDSRKDKFKNELTQKCPDSVSRFFDWHTHFTPGAGNRIHFYPLENSNIIIIGSIAYANKIK